MSLGIGKIAKRQRNRQAELDRQLSNAEAILLGSNPVQRDFINDINRYLGLICPRRSGKTFAMTSKALYHAELHPGARILIISLTLKSTVENYWSGSPGGLFAQNAMYELGIKFNTTSHTWVHPNGSRGLLAGAETKADIEHLRGAAAEADIVIVDECKSFAPSHLNDLLENVVEPGLMTRDGQVILGGTPGSLPLGPFYEATCLLARTGPNADRPTCVSWQSKSDPGPAYSELSKDEVDELYSLHHWTIQDNLAAPDQWRRALATKRRRGWTDDNPTWRREYLGEWVSDDSDLVYSYAKCKSDPNGLGVTWRPNYGEGITGLPQSQGPWHLVLGLDLGYVDDSAMVLAAYSEQLKELRHVYDYKAPGMDALAFAEEVMAICDHYGQIEMIVADTGGGSKMVIETINQRMGLGIQPAQKRDKNDFIELLNGDFNAGRIKIIPESNLEIELCGLQWDLSNDSKIILARTGRLREDPTCPNHLCDALLYVWRFSYHYFAQAGQEGPEPGTDDWFREWEDAQLKKAIAKRRGEYIGRDPHGLGRFANERPLTRETLPWMLPRMSLQNQQSPPSTFRSCGTS